MQKLYRRIRRREAQRSERIQLSRREAERIFLDVFSGRSAVSQQGDATSLTIVRLNPQEPLSVSNALCLTKPEADLHERIGTPAYPEQFLAEVRGALARGQPCSTVPVAAGSMREGLTGFMTRYGRLPAYWRELMLREPKFEWLQR